MFFTILLVYASNTVKERVILFDKLKQWIIQFKKNKDNLIITDDFNCNSKQITV